MESLKNIQTTRPVGHGRQAITCVTILKAGACAATAARLETLGESESRVRCCRRRKASTAHVLQFSKKIISFLIPQ